MGDRSSLGAADVPDPELAAMVADLLGHAAVELLDVSASPVDYDVPSITTVGRWWVSGTARTPIGEEPFRLFVKHVQAWQHSPFFQYVPPEVRDLAAGSYPWRIEAAVYRSDLADRLPDGLTLPRAVGVRELEPDAVVVWLEALHHPDVPWDAARFERAAYLLGRLSANRDVAELGDVGEFDWSVMDYVVGRVLHEVVPRVHSDESWAQPLVAEHFGDSLRDRTRAGCDRTEAHAAELLALPYLVSHGDASPGNLLAGPDPDSIVLIDFGFWLPKPVGYDLGQLVAGDVQLGRLPDLPLDELDELCLAAYTRGMADEGLEIDLAVVRRAHALQLFLFSGVSALPDPGMGAEQVAARAELARFSLDLLDRTG